MGKVFFIVQTLFLSIGLLMPNSAYAWKTPWSVPQQNSAPWISQERKESRENFFKQMTRDDSQEDFEPTNAKEREDFTREIQPAESQQDLKGIPWRAYGTMYPSESFSKQFLWPVEGARILSGYGLRDGKSHEGLDLSGRAGAPVRAAQSGRIVYSGQMGSYGNVVVVYHGAGISSIYAHNRNNRLFKGAVVKKGETIAYVGRTGRATTEHCHFEIRQDGKPVNPLLFSYSQNPLLARNQNANAGNGID